MFLKHKPSCRADARSTSHSIASARGASRSTRPPSTKTTRVASSSARATRCSERTTVAPSRSTAARSSAAASGSSCDIGSSRSRSRGSSASAEARQTRCSSPPESSTVFRPQRWSASSDSSARSTLGQISGGATPRFSSPKATSLATIVITTWSSGSWKTVATVPASSAGRARRVSSPATTTRPSKRPPWKCGTSPARARSNVDLPEPDGPRSATTSPGSSASETSRSAGGAAGYENERPSTATRATAPPPGRAGRRPRPRAGRARSTAAAAHA